MADKTILRRKVDRTPVTEFTELEVNRTPDEFATVPNPARILVVSPSLGHYATLAAAITAASALTPTAANPVSIEVSPGTYTEVNPLTIPAYVHVVGSGGPSATIIAATTTTAAVIEMASLSTLRSIGIQGANGAGGIGAKASGASVNALLQDVIVQDCETAFLATGAGTNLGSIQCLALRLSSGHVLTTGFKIEAGATIRASMPSAIGTPTSLITTGILCTGANSVFRARSVGSQYCTNGLYADDSGFLETESAVLTNAVNAIRVGSTGSGEVVASSVLAEASTTFDLLVESATGTLSFTGSYDTTKVSLAAGSIVSLAAFSSFAGDEGFDVFGELHVGRHDRTSESCFGGGDSHIIGMKVKTNTNGEAGSWVDETADASSVSGSTFTAFPGVTAENAFYVGGDQEFPGVKTVVISTALVIGAGAIVWEFWNGTSWEAFNIMATDSLSPYNQYNSSVFERTSVAEQVRFADLTGWATKALDGDTKYWVRGRITTAITTAPVLEQIKLHTDRAEINADGAVEFFGAAEPKRTFPVHRLLADSITGSIPSNHDLVLSANITLSAPENLFTDGAVKAVGMMFELPEGVDTSRLAEFNIDWYKDGVSGGVSSSDVEWELTKAIIQHDDILDGTVSDVTATEIATAPLGAGGEHQLTHTSILLDISDMIAGDILGLKLLRDATGGNGDDTLVEDVALVQVSMLAFFWR